MEVHFDTRGAHQWSAAALGGAETPFLDSFDGLLVQTKTGVFDDLGVVRAAVRAHLDHQHDDALEPRLARILGELGIYTVDQLGWFDWHTESAGSVGTCF